MRRARPPSRGSACSRSSFVRATRSRAGPPPYNNEPERFWPRSLGTLTKDLSRTTNSDRTLAILADYATKLTLVRGDRFAFPGIGLRSLGRIEPVPHRRELTGRRQDSSRARARSIDYLISQRPEHAGHRAAHADVGPHPRTSRARALVQRARVSWPARERQPVRRGTRR